MNSLKPLVAFGAVLAGALVMYSCSDTSTGPVCCLPPPPVFDSQAAPGDSAKSFLEDDHFSTLQVEIDYMEGYKPTENALDSLKAFLKMHLNKENINIGTPASIPAKRQNAYSAEDIRNLEKEYRDHYTNTSSDTLWAYMLFVDGEYTTANVLGIAYYNTSTAYFGPTIHNNSRESGQVGTQPTRPKMEATVFNHEFGHILGLVNNGTPMVDSHQDDSHGHHCNNDACLMYYAVETTNFFANLFDGSIPDLQQYCRTDLQANGGKYKY